MELSESEAQLAMETMQQYESGNDSNMDFDTISDEPGAPGGWIQWF